MYNFLNIHHIDVYMIFKTKVFLMQGNTFRIKRLELGISQAKVAEYTHIPQAQLSSFELGKRQLTDKQQNLIKNFLLAAKNGEIQILKKRYRKATTQSIPAPRNRKRSYCKTKNNKNYLNLLKDLEHNFKEKKNSELKAISFFAGCGGLCYGAKAAGFDIVATNELEEAYRNIYKLNFPNVNFLPNDITSIKKSDIEEVLGKHKNIDLVLGGPPCQGFSLAGKRNVNDPRNTLFQYYIDIANLIKPKVILMENVRLLTSMRDPDGNLVSDRIIKTFHKYNYNCSYFYINSKDYNVPQSRERVFFIAIREDIQKEPSIPKPKGSTYYTFGDAVSDLEYIESGQCSKQDILHKAVKHPEHVINWLIDVPEGKSAHDNSDPQLRPPSGYNTTYKRQVWNAPGKTVGTTFAMISGSNNVHPIATRAITTREALRLQSFPDSFQVIGNQGDIRTTIGNAVPPLLSYELVKFLKENYIL